MAEMRKRLRQHRNVVLVLNDRFYSGLRHCSADCQYATTHANPRQVLDARDVYEYARLSQSHVQCRHQRLSARQNARVVPVVAQQLNDFFGRVGAYVVERCGFHRFTLSKRLIHCHRPAAAFCPVATRPRRSNNCFSTIPLALSIMRAPTATIFPLSENEYV